MKGVNRELALLLDDGTDINSLCYTSMYDSIKRKRRSDLANEKNSKFVSIMRFSSLEITFFKLFLDETQNQGAVVIVMTKIVANTQVIVAMTIAMTTIATIVRKKKTEIKRTTVIVYRLVKSQTVIRVNQMKRKVFETQSSQRSSSKASISIQRLKQNRKVKKVSPMQGKRVKLASL